MALTAERDAYLRLAAQSIERSEQLAPHFTVRSAKAYGGYVVSTPASRARRKGRALVLSVVDRYFQRRSV